MTFLSWYKTPDLGLEILNSAILNSQNNLQDSSYSTLSLARGFFYLEVLDNFLSNVNKSIFLLFAFATRKQSVKL